MAYCATIGFFDGVHAGHRYLISRLREEANRRGLDSAILTFEQHPETILCGTPKPLLTTFEERTALLKAEGVTEIFCFNFEVIQMMTAEEFMRILVGNCGVSVLLMGYDHHFGSDHLSSFADYQAAAARVGLTILPIEQAPEGDVSSSKIRRALQRGAIESANIMLGYPYTLTGVVVHGRGLGRTLGFPTANLSLPADKILPANGVYAVECLIANSVDPKREALNGEALKQSVGLLNSPHSGLLNIGTNPTVGNDQVSLEVHIPDFEGDLYDTTMTIHLLRYLREEKRFDTLDALKDQIRQDLLILGGR